MEIYRGSSGSTNHVVGEVYTDDNGISYYLCANQKDTYFLINLESGEAISYCSLEQLNSANECDVLVSCRLLLD